MMATQHHEPLMGLGKGHSIPYIAHKRLTGVTAPPHSVRTRPSIIMAEMDRIQRKVRPSLAYRPAEDYLNSRAAVSFDDETRSIRAQTQALLKRIHAPVPRASRAFPISTTRYDYEEPIVPTRITSDAYIERLLGPVRRVQRDVENMARYPEPGNNRRHIGKGHLACISFAGGRAFSRRRNLASEDDRISNDVTYLSHYKKNRNAANGVKEEGQAWNNMNSLIHGPSLVRSRFYKPSYSNDKLTSPREYSPPASEWNKTFVTPSTKPARQNSRQDEAAAAPVKDDVEDTGARMNRRKKEKQEEARLAEEAALKEENEKQQEQARNAELARQEELAQQAALERQAEIERKAAEAQEEEQAKQAAAAAKKAKAEKKAAAEKKAEAEKQAEADRQAAEKQAEAERLAEEERKAEEARKAEAERVAEEARKAEEERVAEEERKAEEVRQAAELAKQQEEELAKLAEEQAKLDAEAAAVEESAPAEAVEETIAAEEAPVEESMPEETPAAVEEVEAPPAEVEVAMEEAAPEESSEPAPTETEPVVEEPQSPDVQETEGKLSAEEVESIAAVPEEIEE